MDSFKEYYVVFMVGYYTFLTILLNFVLLLNLFGSLTGYRSFEIAFEPKHVPFEKKIG